MANTYFSYAFSQHYVCNTTSGYTTSGGTISLLASGTPASLTAGQIGFFQVNSYGEWGNLGVGASSATYDVIMGYGQFHTISGIGANYSNLKDPLMSKQIHWQNVTAFEYKKGHPLQQQVVGIGWDTVTTSGAAAVGPLFYCGTDYTLKLEYLGDPVFAALNKEGYNNLQANGGCCNSTCTSGCTGTAVDAAYVLLQWKDRVNQNPLITPFLYPQVFVLSGGVAVEVFDAYDNSQNSALPIYVPNTANPASVVAGFRVSAVYTGQAPYVATFSPFDRYEYSPIWILASLMMQNGSQCAWTTTINSSVPNMFTQITAAQPWINSGPSVLRDFILSLYYRQQPFGNSLNSVDIIRTREIENAIAPSIVNQTGQYDQVVLTFNATGVSNQNPTGAHNRDQYQLVFEVIAGTSVSTLTTYISSCLTAVGSNVTLVTYN
jgi:hypothetical protein